MTRALRKVDPDSEPKEKPEGEAQEDDVIAEHLRRAYEGFASEPIPDRFRELLEELRRKESE